MILSLLVGAARADDDIEIEVEAETPPPSVVQPAVEPAAVPPAEPPAEPAPAEPAPLAQVAEVGERLGEGLVIWGFIQTEAVFSQLSEDELSPDGIPLNEDRFRVRRGRIHVERTAGHTRTELEIDANTNDGPTLSVRRAEATLFWPNPDSSVPYAEITGGLVQIPFGYEIPQGNRDRVFMERSTGSRALFPGEPDVGLVLAGGVGAARYSLAALNGSPIPDSPTAETIVPTSGKTLLLRVGFDAEATSALRLSGGVSTLKGTGFHAGTTSSKSDLTWVDANQDGFVTLNELVAAPGQASTPSETFDQWAVNADFQLGLRTGLGLTRFSAEATMASNLDRGLYVSDPVSRGHDLRQSAWTLSLMQEELWGHGLVGVRADSYNPDLDSFEARRGIFFPTDLSILTVSPAIGVKVGEDGRFVLQYDYVVDHLGRDDLGQPVDLPNDQFTARLQLEF